MTKIFMPRLVLAILLLSFLIFAYTFKTIDEKNFEQLGNSKGSVIDYNKRIFDFNNSRIYIKSNNSTAYQIGSPANENLMSKIYPYPIDGKNDFNVQINSNRCKLVDIDNNFFTYTCRWELVKEENK